MRSFLLALLAVLLSPGVMAEPPVPPDTVRFATFNVSMFRDREGGLRADLADPTMTQARLAATILQQIRPDVVLLNEFDWDPQGESADLFRKQFLAVGQDGRQPLDYPYVYVPETNTGVHSGHDLDHDGTVTSTPGSRAYGGDAFGFGQFPGQYGFAILSRYPIDYERIRTFRLLRWKDVPDASIPEDWYSPAALGGAAPVFEESRGRAGPDRGPRRARARQPSHSADLRRARGPQRCAQRRRDPFLVAVPGRRRQRLADR